MLRMLHCTLRLIYKTPAFSLCIICCHALCGRSAVALRLQWARHLYECSYLGSLQHVATVSVIYRAGTVVLYVHFVMASVQSVTDSLASHTQFFQSMVDGGAATDRIDQAEFAMANAVQLQIARMHITAHTATQLNNAINASGFRPEYKQQLLGAVAGRLIGSTTGQSSQTHSVMQTLSDPTTYRDWLVPTTCPH